MPANITPSGDYYFNLDIANTMYVGGDISVAGNVYTGSGTFATNNINNGTSNVSIDTPGGNISASVSGNADILVITNNELILNNPTTSKIATLGTPLWMLSVLQSLS